MPLRGIGHLIDHGAVGRPEQDDRSPLIIQRGQLESADDVEGGRTDEAGHSVGIGR